MSIIMNANKLIWIAALLSIVTATLAAVDFGTPDTNEGIIFFTGTWSEAIEKSKAENKPIFLDVYATWCGPCKRLKRNTFSDKAVGEYFNTHYINVSFDGEEEAGQNLMRKYNLHAYPSLLVVDKDENAQVIATGYKSPDDFINFGKTSLKKVNYR